MAKSHRILTQRRLKDVLHYDPETGAFTWRVMTSNRVKVGDAAGCTFQTGNYRGLCIGVDGAVYAAGRLAWLYVHGAWPVEVDHRDGNPLNNRQDNLRECTHAQNQKNVPRPSHNTSGFKGVYWCKQSQKWRARIAIDGKCKHLGLFITAEEAGAAYDAAAVANHGEYARTNR